MMGLGDKTSQYSEHTDLEVTRQERESTEYFKNFTKHSIVKLTFNSLTIVFGGIIMIIFSLYML